ncbi:MAG: hypothetical protein KatS3mg036_0112 [Ignavibacterium sp.]|nr:MAG: hypothetical protein KatS3mg036_0112 [Ignavibacterium sp.]
MGGVSWDSISGNQAAYQYNSVKFVTPQYAIIVGDGGKILISSDGGINWQEQISGTDNALFRVTVVDTATYYVVGDKGTILKTINAGVPVELKSFNATVNGNSVFLEWTTATELNNSGFQIQRREKKNELSDNWVSIGFVKRKWNDH